MATVVDALIVSLNLDASGFVKGQKATTESFKKAKTEISRDARDMEGALRGVTDEIVGLHRTLLGLFAAITGGKSLKALVGDMADLNRSAQNFDVSSKRIDAFGKVIERLGGSADEAKQLFGRFANIAADFKMGNIDEGLVRNIGILNSLGKTNVDVTKPLSGQIDAIANGLARIRQSDPGLANRLAVLIAGSQGAANALLLGSTELGKALADAGKHAPSERSLKIATDLLNVFKQLGEAVVDVGYRIVEAIGPSLIKILTDAKKWVEENIDATKNFAIAVGVAGVAMTALKVGMIAVRAANPFTLLVTAAILAIEYWDKLKGIVDGLKRSLEELVIFAKRDLNSVWKNVFGHPLFDEGPRGGTLTPGAGMKAPRGGDGSSIRRQGADADKRYNDPNEFYDSIIKAEGTGKHGDPYNTSLGYMKSPKPLTQMTMDEALAWGNKVRAAQGLDSSAKGAFQIVNTTQRAAMRALGIRGDEMFSEENQRRMASWIARHQGLGAWEGFKHHPGQRARAAAALAAGRDHQTQYAPAAAPGGSLPFFAQTLGAPGAANIANSNSSTVNNSSSNSAQIGAINISAPSGDAPSIRDALGDFMSTQLFGMQTNYGAR